MAKDAITPLRLDSIPSASKADLAVPQRRLPDMVADAIVRGIGRGLLKPGERLYEPNLCDRLQVSRAPIREALRILQAQGIVEGEPQRGLRICNFDIKRSEELYEIRLALEHISIPKAADAIRTDLSAARQLEQLISDMEVHVARNDRLALNEADLAFHGELVRLSGNDVLINFWRGLARQILIILALETDNEVPLAAIHAQHVTLLQAMLNPRQKSLAAAIDSHIAGPHSDGWPGT
jgi:DNA-binding GntR family transcriptional regulator